MRRSPQRGFSLIIVFLLILVMVGIAAAVMLSTQTDLQVAGTDREAQTAFYAAEGGVAFAKDWLATQNIGTGSSAFSSLLASNVTAICQPGNGARPGVVPKTAQPKVAFQLDSAGSPISRYQFCIHNNADDPTYLGSPPSLGDTTDGDGIVEIESYGFGPNNTQARVTAEIQLASSTTAVNDYAGEGGGGTKARVGEKGTVDSTQQASF